MARIAPVAPPYEPEVAACLEAEHRSFVRRDTSSLDGSHAEPIVTQMGSWIGHPGEAIGWDATRPRQGSSSGSAVATAAPTPGGLGALEAALIAGLVAAGMENTIAVPAVFLYRLATFWLPILPGWASFTYLRREEYI